jgi:hypothetical protein
MAEATLCKDCQKQPIVPYHDRCQQCLIRLARKKLGQRRDV